MRRRGKGIAPFANEEEKEMGELGALRRNSRRPSSVAAAAARTQNGRRSHARRWDSRKRGSEAVASGGPGVAWRRRRSFGPGRGSSRDGCLCSGWDVVGGERLWVFLAQRERDPGSHLSEVA
ncbi:hypothetical protein VIGAN_01097400 [Vigna angularis var. angularis]|uniref:Uncharacterized protein n=1 Tax=Vigna angularis var. angularis TaxID=157739 RepID=A0A0S3QYS4_PHAAN|nr:hypothetical protein VIGAN_01097400 [Vigna angularis var. angularis]